ncbi:MAG: glycosyltransferase [Patescibacteria group bacterium]
MRLLILTQKVDSADDNLGFFHRWIEEFAKQCEKVTVICLFEGKHALPNNVSVLSLGKEKGVSKLTYLVRFYTYIWKERKHYDVVFVHMNQIYVILGWKLWWLLGKKVSLWYAHGKTTFSLRLATFFTQSVVTSTKEGFRIETKKKRIVGQGIDPTLFVQKTDYIIGDTFKLVTAGRITSAKQIEKMIDTVSDLRTKKIPATLTLIGSGDTAYTETLIAHARSKNVSEYVEFLGGMPYAELTQKLYAYDVFFNLGITGSLDKALLDAAAAKLPIVTTNTAFDFAVTDPQKKLEEFYKTSPEDRKKNTEHVHEWLLNTHTLKSLVTKTLSYF